MAKIWWAEEVVKTARTFRRLNTQHRNNPKAIKSFAVTSAALDFITAARQAAHRAFEAGLIEREAK